MAVQFHIRQHHYLFTFKVGFFLLCLFFFCVFCLCGSWQLQRYSYKKNLLLTYETRSHSAPELFSSVSQRSSDEMQFQPVTASGHYLNSLMILIQNKQYKGQMGYEVLTPFEIAGEKKLLLVDRGWRPAQKNHQLPMIETINDPQNITGHIKLLNEHQFILGKNILSASPLIMQKIDMQELEQVTHQSFYPFILRLNASQKDGFVREWTISASLPQRHMGYAVQWFAMALVLLIAYFSFCIERVKK